MHGRRKKRLVQAREVVIANDTRLFETIRVKEVAKAREVLLGTDEIAAKETRIHLSNISPVKARGAALALGEVEYLVRQQGSGGVLTRGPTAPANPEELDCPLGQIATLLGQITGALGGRARLVTVPLV